MQQQRLISAAVPIPSAETLHSMRSGHPFPSQSLSTRTAVLFRRPRNRSLSVRRMAHCLHRPDMDMCSSAGTLRHLAVLLS